MTSTDGDIAIVVTLTQYDTIQAALAFWARKGAGISLICGLEVQEPELNIARQHGEIALAESGVISLRKELEEYHLAQAQHAIVAEIAAADAHEQKTPVAAKAAEGA